MLTTIEKVIFLQDIDIFKYTSTEDLAHIAAITEEVNCSDGTVLYREGEVPDAIYMVVEGSVRLHKDRVDVMVAKNKDAFGTWALLDAEPRVVTATVVKESTLLKISREDFFDLLSDNIGITQSLFKALVEKVRSLV